MADLTPPGQTAWEGEPPAPDRALITIEFLNAASAVLTARSRYAYYHRVAELGVLEDAGGMSWLLLRANDPLIRRLAANPTLAGEALDTFIHWCYRQFTDATTQFREHPAALMTLAAAGKLSARERDVRSLSVHAIYGEETAFDAVDAFLAIPDLDAPLVARAARAAGATCHPALSAILDHPVAGARAARAAAKAAADLLCRTFAEMGERTPLEHPIFAALYDRPALRRDSGVRRHLRRCPPRSAASVLLAMDLTPGRFAAAFRAAPVDAESPHGAWQATGLAELLEDASDAQCQALTPPDLQRLLESPVASIREAAMRHAGRVGPTGSRATASAT